MARTVKSAIALVASAALLTACNWGQPGFSGDNQNSNPAVHNFGPAEAATLHEVWHRAYSDPRRGPAESPGGLVHVSISPEHDQYATVEGIDQRSGTRTWYHAVDLIIPEWGHLLPPVVI